MKNTFYSYSFGCRVNQAEKEEVDRKLVGLGFVQDEADADIFIINTCSVTNKAEREARQLIYKLKREKPKSKLVVTGCAVTNWQKNGLFKDLPIDLAVDNLNKQYLVDLLRERLFGNSLATHNRVGYGTRASDKFVDSGRFLIKIQDGCHRFCSFCIVPYLRGTPKSLRIKVIVNVIKKQESNIKEVILTAINTESFGQDTGETFPKLIRSVLQNTTAPRLSFGSIHPWSINDEFLNLYKNFSQSNRWVNFFHIPIQSGSNKILSLMKRGYTREEMLEKLYAIDRIKSKTLLATDIICGFLEETDEDFRSTFEFFEKAPISRFHVFRFSKRQKTAAYYLSKRLKSPSEKVKLERSKALISLSRKKYSLFMESLIGASMSALILPKTSEGFYEGTLENQVPVFVKTNKKNLGQIVNVNVSSFKSGALFGKIV